MSTLKVDDIQSRQSTDDAISLAADSSVTLKHSASAKLTTTSTGVDVTGTCTATTFSGSGASLTSLPAANLTGTLPALSAANLTSIPAANLTGTLPALSAANLTSIPAANITGTFTSLTDSKGDLRDIPQNSQTSAYTLVAADAGKHISITTGGVTIPASIFAAGDAITIVNNSASDQTITCSAVTTYLANDTSTKSSLTLKARGVATFLFVSATVVYGAGAGLE